MTQKDIDVLNEVIETLLDVLVEKGIIDRDDFDERVNDRLEKSRKLTKFDDLED